MENEIDALQALPTLGIDQSSENCPWTCPWTCSWTGSSNSAS